MRNGRYFALFQGIRVAFGAQQQQQQQQQQVLWPFVRDYPDEPVPEETLTHPPS